MTQRTTRALQVVLALALICGVVWLTVSGGLNATQEAEVATPAYGSFIVQGQDATQIADLVEAHGGTVSRLLPIIDGVQARLTSSMANKLARETAVSSIMADAPVRATDLGMRIGAQTAQPTADYGEVVGSDVVWGETENATGRGMTVAVVDTGIDPNIPGLNFNADGDNRDIAWVDFIDGDDDDDMAVTSVDDDDDDICGGDDDDLINDDDDDVLVDPHGHGTHIAGIIASSYEGEDGRWNGIAPNADLVSVRVLDETGWSNYGCVIAGIQWVVDHKDEHNIRIMNLSLVATPQSPYWADPLNQAVMAAWEAGIVVVAAAGNGGPDPMTVGVPGNTPYVITVGAFTDDYTPDDWTDDYITPFSAAGPTLDGFVKPDVVAPGAHMVSTMKSDTYLARNHTEKVIGTHFEMAGTSQATAVVSGIAALVLSHPDNAALTPDQVKYRVMHTALLWMDEETDAPLYSVWQQGAGRVNAPDAVFTDTIEAANYGITLTVDLADPNGGYQGYTHYDPESGYFYLYEMPETWANGYSTWAGGYSTWAGGYSTWAGGYSTWAGGYSTWAGGYSTWAGGYSTWAGGYTGWLETPPGAPQWASTATSNNDYPWPSRYNDPEFMDAYKAGEAVDISHPIPLEEWIEERDWANPTIYLPMLMGE